MIRHHPARDITGLPPSSLPNNAGILQAYAKNPTLFSSRATTQPYYRNAPVEGCHA